MDLIALIERFYPPGSTAHHYLLQHSRLVAQKALRVARRLPDPALDLRFIEEACLLHDIGIFLTDAPHIGCRGRHPYIAHGYLGRDLLEREGLRRHALICERHVGVGITLGDIEARRLPLPQREMVPLTLEEKIVCFADKFYSKLESSLTTEKPLAAVRASIARYGDGKLKVFDEWVEVFGEGG